MLGDEVKVRFRLSTTGTDYQIHAYKGEKVGSLVTKLKSKAGVSLICEFAGARDRDVSV